LDTTVYTCTPSFTTYEHIILQAIKTSDGSNEYAYFFRNVLRLEYCSIVLSEPFLYVLTEQNSNDVLIYSFNMQLIRTPTATKRIFARHGYQSTLLKISDDVVMMAFRSTAEKAIILG